jgi:hypothetical protein
MEETFRRVRPWGIAITALLFLRGILPLAEHIQFVYQTLESFEKHKDFPVFGPLLNLSGYAYLTAVGAQPTPLLKYSKLL